MGSEGFFGVIALLVAWGFAGLIIAFAIKILGKRERLPGWPILWSAMIGTTVTMMLGL